MSSGHVMRSLAYYRSKTSHYDENDIAELWIRYASRAIKSPGEWTTFVAMLDDGCRRTKKLEVSTSVLTKLDNEDLALLITKTTALCPEHHTLCSGKTTSIKVLIHALQKGHCCLANIFLKHAQPSQKEYLAQCDVRSIYRKFHEGLLETCARSKGNPAPVWDKVARFMRDHDALGSGFATGIPTVAFSEHVGCYAENSEFLAWHGMPDNPLHVSGDRHPSRECCALATHIVRATSSSPRRTHSP